MPSREPWVLGIAASHNGSACLLRGDEIVAAVQEERLLRSKRALTRGAHDPLSVRYCLNVAGISPEQLSMVVLCAAQSSRSPDNDLLRNRYLRLAEHAVPCLKIPHHLGHAVGAFATSSYSDAAVLVVDGMGSPHADLTVEEQRVLVGQPVNGHETISSYAASGTSLRPIEKHLVDEGRWLWRPADHPHGMQCFGSLGGMYSAVGEQIFGDPLDGAGKVMGLAPYGTPNIATTHFLERVGNALRFKDTVPRRFADAARWPHRQHEYQNLAASVQRALEQTLLDLVKHLQQLTGLRRLCYAGGVALNSVANERIVREGGFDDVFIMPAAEDSGTAAGAAYFGLWQLRSTLGRPRRRPDSLGYVYPATSIQTEIERTPAVRLRTLEHTARDTARLLAAGKILGWFQGGSELGPRALGRRSILADARDPGMKDALNRRIKGREPFRPFAPVILEEEAAAWFEVEAGFASPYMLRVCDFKEDTRGIVPAVVHVDGTGRVQTVSRDDNPLLHHLLEEFRALTGVPLLLNTSFNIAGDPIVETPQDALWTLLNTDLDGLVIGEWLVRKVPGYGSVLDLRGTVIVDSPVIHEPLHQRARHPYQALPCAFSEAAWGWMQSELSSLDIRYATFRVPTRWGIAIHAYPEAFAGVARLLDGRASGWHILERLRSQAHPRTDANWLSGVLRAFGRDGIATFAEIR